MRQRLAVVAVLVCVVFATAALAARIGDRQESPALSSQRYERSIALRLDYGNAQNEVGIRVGDFETRPEGPESFAVADDGTIAIADSLHERVAVFDQNGHIVRSAEGVIAGDIEISGDSMFVLEPASSRLIEITSQGKRVDAVEVDASADRITPSLIQRMARSGRLTAQSQHAINDTPPAYSAVVADDHTAVIAVQDSRFTVVTDNSLGSINLVGTDAEGNVFLALEQVLPTTDSSISVQTEVRKYSSRGELLARIPMDMDTVTQPGRPFVVTPDGTLYHLKPTREVLLIERFDIR